MKQFSVSLAYVRLYLLLALFTFVGGHSNAKSFTLDGIRYEVLSETDKTCEVDDWATSNETIVLPESPNGYRLVSIGNMAFDHNKTLKSITIPSSVLTISDGAFSECENLTTVNFSSGLEIIKRSAFTGCKSLAGLTLPSTLKELQDGAFNNCVSLTAIHIPASLSNIDWSVFSGCSSLTEITVDSENPDYSNYKGIMYNKEQTEIIACPPGIREIELSPKLTSLNYGFGGVVNLKTLTIPTTITSIGAWVFSSCYNLEEIEIPATVESLGDALFYECSSLKKVVLPEGITKIGMGMFWQCSELREFSIPSTVTSIDEIAFAGCTSLPSLTIPEGVEKIADKAFQDCKLVPVKFLSYNEDFEYSDAIGYMDWKSVVTCKSDYYQNFKEITPNGMELLCWDSQYRNNITPDGLTAEINVEENPYWDTNITNTDYKLQIYNDEEELIKEFNVEKAITLQLAGLSLSTNYKVVSTWKTPDYTAEYTTSFRTLSTESAVEVVSEECHKEVCEYYNALGQRINNLQKGLNIIKYSNGESKKVVVK